MTNKQINVEHLEYAPHPGEVLLDVLENHQLTQRDLAQRIDITPKHINQIIKGKASISSTTAQKLAFVFGTSSDFWLNLQKNFEAVLARNEIEKQFEKEKHLLADYRCYVELAKMNFIKQTKSPKERYIELLNFFGLSSLELVPKNYAIQFRHSPSDNTSPAAMAAWLRIGELQSANRVLNRPYDQVAFRKSLDVIRRNIVSPIDQSSKKLVRLCEESGVLAVFTPYIPKTNINGATRWLPSGNPIIQVSSRMKRRDIFWFTFFHEAAHVLKHSKRNDYIDLDKMPRDNPEEAEADAFAADILIPREKYEQFKVRGIFSDVSIKTFSGEVNVSADIVAGRLAKDGLIEWSQAMHFNEPITIRQADEQD